MDDGGMVMMGARRLVREKYAALRRRAAVLELAQATT